MSLKIKVKYFEGQDKKLNKISKGDWIDMFANADVFIPLNEMKLVPLGIAMQLPEGYEAHLAPRSSTFKTWGCIQTNSFGIIDNSFAGDLDEWKIPLFCLSPRDTEEVLVTFEGSNLKNYINGTWVRKGDKICQARVVEIMPPIDFVEVEALESVNRGGFGSSGSR